jgi:galactose mutarotase-like enzyme
MVLQQRREPFPHWEYTDPSGAEVLRVVPERGGLVTAWSSLGRDWIYFDAERFADPSLSVRGGIPVLFPICGGLPSGRLSLPQGDFSLAQHGFARDRPWSLSALEDGRGVRLELGHDADTLAAYPFRFRLRLDYRLAPGELAITVQVSNAGEEPMPFSFGLHPYWAVADLAAVRLEGLPAAGFDHHTMAPAALAGQLDALSEGVDLLAHPRGPVRLLGAAGGGTVTLEPSAPLDLVVLWTDPPRPMLCLEPWTAPRGALISGERRLTVEPGGSCSLSCRYRVAPGGG